MKRASPEFAATVRAVLAQHDSDPRRQQAQTGIHYVTIYDWLRGAPASLKAAVAFAKGFGLNVDEFIVLAGHEPIDSNAGTSLSITLSEACMVRLADLIGEAMQARFFGIARYAVVEPNGAATPARAGESEGTP